MVTMCRVLMLLAISQVLATTSAEPRAPFVAVPEVGQDIVGNDLYSTKSSDWKDCMNQCIDKNTQGCRAVTWTAKDGGTCFLKSDARFVKTNAKATSARILGKPYTQAGIHEDFDYTGTDIGNAHEPIAYNCIEKCRTTIGCRFFSWSNYQGGTCWFKNGTAQAVNRPGIIAGEAYPSGFLLQLQRAALPNVSVSVNVSVRAPTVNVSGPAGRVNITTLSPGWINITTNAPSNITVVNASTPCANASANASINVSANPSAHVVVNGSTSVNVTVSTTAPSINITTTSSGNSAPQPLTFSQGFGTTTTR